jgi:hypothetical protein
MENKPDLLMANPNGEDVYVKSYSKLPSTPCKKKN